MDQGSAAGIAAVAEHKAVDSFDNTVVASEVRAKAGVSLDTAAVVFAALVSAAAYRQIPASREWACSKPGTAVSSIQEELETACSPLAGSLSRHYL